MDSPLKVWHLISNRWNSAITEYALSCARSLQELGWETYFSPVFKSPAEGRALAYKLDIYSFESFSILDILHVYRLLQKIQPDVVITYGGNETFLMNLLAGKKRAHPFSLVRFRGQTYDKANWLELKRLELAHKHVKLILTPAKMVEEQVVHLDQKKNVCTVPLGLDTKKFYPQFMGPETLEADRQYFLIFGRFDPVKGHHRFLKIFAHFLTLFANSDLPKPLLYIVGKPENVSLAQIHRFCDDNHLRVGKDVVIDTEKVKNVSKLLAKTCIGVVPSVGSEVIGRVSQEFLLCGTPIFVSGVGSLEELLFEGAGVSYRHLQSDAEIANLLFDFYQAKWQEPFEAKQERAIKAKQLFSFQAMGKSVVKAFTNSGCVVEKSRGT